MDDLRLEDVGDRGWNALDGDLLFPVLVLKDSALRHNTDVMARFCRDREVSLAPHGKTTMSPQLIRRQLDAGAWGITAATPVQARAMRAAGASRVLIANQVPDRLGLRWIAAEMAGNPEALIFSLVDSPRLVEVMGLALRGAAPGVQMPVLVEMGIDGGRTGCRTIEEAMEVAAAVQRTPELRLAGVEGYEGVIAHDASPTTLERVDEFLRDVRRLAEDLATCGAFAGAPEILVTAGGSLYFDRVVEVLGAPWTLRRPVRVVVRSGCYLTHDHGSYFEHGPLGTRVQGWPRLQPALEIWGMVHSRPESQLAVVGFGKRDVSYDSGLPIPLTVRDHGGERAAPAGMEVFRLNDQHAYLRLPADDRLGVGDLVGCGLRHPCTVFDKWRVIPVVDDQYRVLEAVETLF
jgi:D-serine deaminase-like pyridoxal phosphate-dependent protein